jgi:hypothetical protein
VRNALVLACSGLVGLVAVTVLVWSVTTLIARLSSSASPRSSASASLRAGDCLQDPGQTLGNLIKENGPFTAAPCTQPHTAEVFFAGNAWPRSLPYPGDEAVRKEALARCGIAFNAYDGIDSSVSAFDVEPFLPNRRTWLGGDRRLVCFASPGFAVPGDEPVNYSIRGSRQ